MVHQNIAIAKNLKRDDSNGSYYFILECINGDDLRRWIHRKSLNGALPLKEVLPVIQQVAEALGITQRKYSYLETGVQQWTEENLVKLAVFYGVSIDYLLGQTSIPQRYPPRK